MHISESVGMGGAAFALRATWKTEVLCFVLLQHAPRPGAVGGISSSHT